MDKKQLAFNIEQLSDETIECLRLLRKGVELFQFDTETHEDLEEFMSLIRIKALRIKNPRNKKDITKNIIMKEVEEWHTINHE